MNQWYTSWNKHSPFKRNRLNKILKKNSIYVHETHYYIYYNSPHSWDKRRKILNVAPSFHNVVKPTHKNHLNNLSSSLLGSFLSDLSITAKYVTEISFLGSCYGMCKWYPAFLCYNSTGKLDFKCNWLKL